MIHLHYAWKNQCNQVPKINRVFMWFQLRFCCIYVVIPLNPAMLGFVCAPSPGSLKHDLLNVSLNIVLVGTGLGLAFISS